MKAADFQAKYGSGAKPSKAASPPKAKSGKELLSLKSPEASKAIDNIVIVGKCHVSYHETYIVVSQIEGEITVKIK